MTNEKKPFKRKKRSPFGLVDDVLGTVETISRQAEKVTVEKPIEQHPEEDILEETAPKVALHSGKKSKSPESLEPAKAAKPKRERALFKQYESRFNLHSKRDALSEGFLMLPNLLVMEIMHAKLGVNEYQVLFAIFRLTVGFQKESESISIGVISDMTGIKTRSRISKALNGLEDRGFITRVSGGVDCPSVLGISARYTDQLNLSNRGSKIISADNFLDNELKKHKSLSKRKSEQDYLVALRARFSDDVITGSYKYILEKGDLKKGSEVHSPFRYLDQAIERINEIVSDSKVANSLEENRRKASKKLESEQASRAAEKEEATRKILEKIDLGLRQSFTEEELKRELDERYTKEIESNTSLSGIPKSIMSLKLKRDLAIEKEIISKREVEQL